MSMLRKTTLIKQKMHSLKHMNLSILLLHQEQKLPSLPQETLILKTCIDSTKDTVLTTIGLKIINGNKFMEIHQSLQPDGFVDLDHPEKVYCLRKALYGLKQAPRAWSTNPKFSKKFEKLMHSRFEMSLMGEMKFFLGLQICQSPRGIFINQSKYALEILKRHRMDKCNNIGTPMATSPKLDANLSGTPVDKTKYQSMIGSLMYLTANRPVRNTKSIDHFQYS
ncbi:retrovirus-related pol polyprotein from transposon TNT 1-94 [Tanacetum coccineum]